MKRCPECEFIYEDEQINCDMDGTILAFDASVAAANAVSRSQLRSFALPAIVGSMLAALLFAALYASPLMFASPDERGQPAKAQTPVSAKPATTKPANPQPSTLPSAEAVSDERRAAPGITTAHDREPARTSPTNSRGADGRLTIRRGVPALPRVPSLRRLPPARVGAPASSPQTTRHGEVQRAHGDSKRPSKVGAFLKKTGRIIKKPFKF